MSCHELRIDMAASIVGVVDLLDGQAVHAQRGDRKNYQPVPVTQGDARRLAQAYCQLGIKRIYLADLNAITQRHAPSCVIDEVLQVVSPDTAILLDLGWRGNHAGEETQLRELLDRLDGRANQVLWIAASESATSESSIGELVELVGGDRVLAGFDFQNGKWLGRISYQRWLKAASDHDVAGAVVIDLAGVGSASGPLTLASCRSLSRALPNGRLFSGGGIRNDDDVIQFIHAGCEACLVATSLYPHVAEL